MDGNVKYYIENESYELTKGDILVIPPGKLHRPVIEENIPYERYVLWLYNSYVSSRDGIGRYIEAIDHTIGEKNTRLASFEGDELLKLTDLFDQLIHTFSSDDELAFYTSESYNILILEKILHTLKQTEKAKNEDGNIATRVISYLNRSITDAPSLDELSAHFYVSKYYLSHKFKEYTKIAQ